MRVYQAFTLLLVFLLASSTKASDETLRDEHLLLSGHDRDLSFLGEDEFRNVPMFQLHVPDYAKGDEIDYFGYAVALKGNLAAVAAPFDDLNGAYSGAVHLFQRSYGDEWSYFQRIEPDYPMPLDHFGRQLVFMDGNDGLILAVGSPGRENHNPHTESDKPGRIFFFEQQRDGYFTQHSVLEGYEANDSFGQAISYCPQSGRLAVGALSSGEWRRGKVYIFEREYGLSFRESAIVSGSDHLDGKLESFGFKLKIKGDDLVVAAPGRDNGRDWIFNPINPIGKVYIFQQTVQDLWKEVQVIVGPKNPGLPLNIFGRGLWFDGERLIIASPFYSLTPLPKGAVFFYERNMLGQFQQKQLLVAKTNTLALGRGIYEMNNVLYMGAWYLYPNSPDWITNHDSPVDVGGVVKVFEPSSSWLGNQEWQYDSSFTSANPPPPLTLASWGDWFVRIIREGLGSPQAEPPFDTFGLGFSGDDGYLLVGGPEQRQAWVVDVRGF